MEFILVLFFIILPVVVVCLFAYHIAGWLGVAIVLGVVILAFIAMAG